MNLIPSYIDIQNLDQPVNFKWDDWDPYPLIGKNNDQSEQLLSRISHRGKFVFSIGCAEWVVARLNNFLTNDDPWKYLHACWAYELSEDYDLPYELDDDKWLGNVLGPICLSLTTIINTRYGFDEDNAEIDSAFAEKIALYVLSDDPCFINWRDTVISRLADYSSNQKSKLGERLPMQILDPKITIDSSRFSQLIESSLNSLNLDDNLYVNSNLANE